MHIAGTIQQDGLEQVHQKHRLKLKKLMMKKMKKQRSESTTDEMRVCNQNEVPKHEDIQASQKYDIECEARLGKQDCWQSSKF